jgi:uncharacterized phiE125 gp8 family phage protein
MPPFWAQGGQRAIAPHMTSVPVTPAVAIVASTIAAATVLETLAPHLFVSGDTVAILGHVGSTPALDGSRVVTVIDALHVSIPVTVTVAGAGGTATRTVARQPLTLAEGKLRAGLEWVDGDPRDALMLGFIAAAASQLQQDTGVVPLLQPFDVYFDALPRGPIALPWRPVPSVPSFASIDSAGVVQTLDAVNYELDPSSDQARPARIALSTTGAWPTDLRSFQPYVLRIVAGYASVALLPPWIVEAIGILVAHAATSGRDRFTEAALRDEYAEKIAPYQLVVVP